MSILRLEELSTPQLDALDRDRTVVILPVSPLETHGPHLPVGVDAFTARHFAEAVAERVVATRPGWSALLAPARLPPAIVARLNEAARLAMKRPDVAEKFRAKGSDAVATEPEFARKFVAGEVERWRRVIKEAGIPPQN